MNQPTQEQIDRIIGLLRDSIQELIDNDSDIFNIDIVMPQNISDDEIILNRKLHETTINHRLAYYLEKNIQNTELSNYSVDIEYNRFYENPKKVQTIEGQITARPDILIHGRINGVIVPQHFLVVEAKKDAITAHDINKIKGFISDHNYNYLFGFTVSYCSNNAQIIGNIYYYNGTEITSIPLNVDK